MLETLIASKPVRRRSAPAVLFSATAHVSVLYLAYAGTRAVAAGPAGPVADTTLVFIQGLAPQLQTARPPAPSAGDGAPSRVIVQGGPPAQGFQVVAPPTSIPTGIPPVDIHQQVIDPSNYTGKGVEGGVSWGEPGGTGKIISIEGNGSVHDLLYAADTRDQRFIPAQMRVRPVPVYPKTMELAGIPGRVVLQFVIDTVGQVEPTSIIILEQSHPGFVTAARDAILEARFQPAQFGDHHVRQLSKISIGFKLAETSGG